jgi:hypothetical protein
MGDDHTISSTGEDSIREALDEFLALAYNVNASSGEEGRTWTREELYDRADE